MTLHFTPKPEYVVSNYSEIKGKNGIYKFHIYITCSNLPTSYEPVTIGTIDSTFLTNTTIILPSKNNDIWLYIGQDGTVSIRNPQGGNLIILSDVMLY